VIGIEVLSNGALNRSQDKFLADSEDVLVVAAGAIAAVDLSLVDGVEGADGTASLEGELA